MCFHLNIRERKRDCRSYMTVTNCVVPLINAKGSVLIAKLRSVSRGMPPTCRRTSSSLSIVSSSPVPKRFCCRRYWIRVCLRSLILFQECVARFTSNLFMFSLICSGSASKSSVLPSFHALSQSTLEVHPIASFELPR